MNTQSTRLQPIQIGILILGLAAALIHLVVLNAMMGQLDILFTLNGLGFLVLLATYFIPGLRALKKYVRWLLIGYTGLTILAWVAIGSRTLLGYGTQVVEIGLIVLLILDGRKKGNL